MGKRRSTRRDHSDVSVKESVPESLHKKNPELSTEFVPDEIIDDLSMDISTDENPTDKQKALLKMKSDKSKQQPNQKKSGKKKDGTKGEDDTDSEEERWLDAIESGKLEEVDDELKRMKNPRLMTARQRALLEKRSDGPDDLFPSIPPEPLLALPSGFKEKVVTEEMLRKKEIKTKRRREQAQEKREEEKKRTVDRLLKKQDSRAAKLDKVKEQKKDTPTVTYIDSIHNGITMSCPVGWDFPLQSSVKKTPPKPKLCQVSGCRNLKKYSCSKTQVWLCSKACYDKNLISAGLK